MISIHKHLIRLCLVSTSWIVGNIAFAQDERLNSKTSEHAQFFETRVRPLLALKCFQCHGKEKSKGGLRLDSLQAMIAGGDSGAALVPGKPEESLLVEAINYDGLEMPPDEKMTSEDIEILTQWIRMGAPWPGSTPHRPSLAGSSGKFDPEDLQWWAVQPLADPQLPELQGMPDHWSKHPIDRFVYGKMASHGLKPAPEANKLAIVRRLYLSVTGLPPLPDQVSEFLNDSRPDAYQRLVDQLLDSKAYAEHAARQWLDLTRYADSDGYRADAFRPNAYHYRDYVIRSLHADKPYDRFVQEQIAGDEMFPEENDAQFALGYLRQWVYEWNIRDARTQWKTILEDMTDTTADVFMGLGLQCAKCHNHKFDPLLQKDYFQLQGFFASVMPYESVVATKQEKAEYERKMKIWETKTEEIRNKIAAIEKTYREKFKNIAIERFPDDLEAIARKPEKERSTLEAQLAYLVQRQVDDEYVRLDSAFSANHKEEIVALKQELKAFDNLKPAPLPEAMVVRDYDSQPPLITLPKRPNEPIEPDFPVILRTTLSGIEAGKPLTANDWNSTPSSHADRNGRRTALARWLTNPTNPLTTRVIVNRIWQSHFSRGLAANPSDFGRLGGPPSHPELLDWLARDFVKNGWSLKKLHRQILLSATYRQSTNHPQFESFQQIDPQNRFLWRQDTKRLTAEQIRDALLLVSGELKNRDGGPAQLADSPFRTIYTRAMRNSPDQLLDSFDLPQFFSSNASRNTTTTPVQSLLMINSDQIMGFARKLAALAESQSSDQMEQVRLLWVRVYGREPSKVELEESLKFLSHQLSQIKSGDSDSSTGRLETGKLPYRDGQAARFDVKKSTLNLSAAHTEAMNVKDFTVETFFQVRSVAETGAVRTLAGKWNGSNGTPGWRFGITGAGSRRKPQTLVLQMVGDHRDGKVRESAIFSDQLIKLNTPYYASASFKAASNDQAGSVTFYLKDLSNDDESLQSAVITHEVTGGIFNRLPLTLGGLAAKDPQWFDGLLDDVRFVSKPLNAPDLLFTVEKELDSTIGLWQFETVPGVLRDSSAHHRNLKGSGSAIVELSPEQAALADFCHALLNSNEFLYQN